MNGDITVLYSLIRLVISIFMARICLPSLLAASGGIAAQAGVRHGTLQGLNKRIKWRRQGSLARNDDDMGSPTQNWPHASKRLPNAAAHSVPAHSRAEATASWDPEPDLATRLLKDVDRGHCRGKPPSSPVDRLECIAACQATRAACFPAGFSLPTGRVRLWRDDAPWRGAA